jgi:hypothetical protein
MVRREDCVLGFWSLFMFLATMVVVYFVIDADTRWKNMTPAERTDYYKTWYKSRCCDAKGRCSVSGVCYDHLMVIFDQNKEYTSSSVRHFIDATCPRRYSHRRDRYETYCNVGDVDKIGVES